MNLVKKNQNGKFEMEMDEKNVFAIFDSAVELDEDGELQNTPDFHIEVRDGRNWKNTVEFRNTNPKDVETYLTCSDVPKRQSWVLVYDKDGKTSCVGLKVDMDIHTDNPSMERNKHKDTVDQKVGYSFYCYEKVNQLLPSFTPSGDDRNPSSGELYLQWFDSTDYFFGYSNTENFQDWEYEFCKKYCKDKPELCYIEEDTNFYEFKVDFYWKKEVKN